ncbi:ATP-dependent RNA helicase DDX24-like isoform X2 [Acanthaster planci]|uniref:RNA helicase n=1 Tax=Acanthaster planci TaxID=133434 RepID=A0A8B7ZCJ2_ACAPL|nr:ATP-dependent RNA helicase DDX24-like isoform X1 [Acanthaster planci]XP_022102556.1 ATP-dependent RNA helicase DDX24-like isoform X2 [Acanthaster planci]
MATSRDSTSSKFDPAFDQVHRRKKMKKKPKLETGKTEESDVEFKGKWTVADVDYSALKLDELREFMGIEELSMEHAVVTGKPSSAHSKRSRNRGKRRRKQQQKQNSTENQQVSPPKKQKMRNQRKNASQDHTMSGKMQQELTKSDIGKRAEEVVEVTMNTKRKSIDKVKTENQNPMQSKKEMSFTKGISVPKKDSNVNMPAWKTLHVPLPVLKALQDLGYKEPTPIQKASIPSAIKDSKDIVGAAETGSGKTLAFGIPVIHNILQHKAALRREARSKIFKVANTESTDTTKQQETSTKRTVKETASDPKKEQKAIKSPHSKRSDGKPLELERTVVKSKTKQKMTGQEEKTEIQEQDSEDTNVEDNDEFEMEETEDDDEDEDIEYDFDDDDEIDEDEAESIDFDEDDADDSEGNIDDIEDWEQEDGGDFAEAQNDEDCMDDEGDNDDDKDLKGKVAIKKKEKIPVENDKPSDRSKKPKGKKGQRKRKFRTRERKVVELDGAEFEGIELINKMDKRGFGCVRAIDDISDAELLSQVGLGEVVEQIDDAGDRSSDDQELYAMILTPTRELAIQVKNHLVAASKYTDIQIAVIVGGMSAQKQERVLRKRPEIVVGTPGRIWELFREGEPHLSTMSGVRCLVLDEADRMIEKGHYEQLIEILHHMNNSPASLQRQTFVFSATLTLVHLGPDRKNLANKTNKNNPKQEKKDRKEKLNALMKKVGIRDDPKVVDLTQKQGTVASLMEAKIICDVTDKDVYLYYFLLQFPGRTLVFCNSIDCIRRLCSILTLLACNPLPLHSSMHQKQRLKNLDRFASNSTALLLATDVAARGLDIPDVQHVIHYQVPRTSEIYIHRSGRTARQAKEGISIMLVAPSEAHFYKRVCKTLKRDDIPSFPVDHMYYSAVKERVDLARLIDLTNHRMEKKKHTNNWFIKAAKDLDVDLDEDLILHDLGDAREQGQHERKLQHMKGELKSLLKRTIFPRGSSWLYPTAAGKLVSPLTLGTSSALGVVKSKVDKRKLEASQQAEAEPPKKVKKSKNKFKRAADETAI